MTCWSVGVVIPARDEEDHLGACLDSVRRAADRVERRGDRVEVVVVADACRDSTAAVAEAMVRGWGAVLAVEIGSAGGSRAAGVRAYLAHQDRALESTWLASTDADTVVPETWIDHQLGLARLGVAGVAGIVAVDSFTDHPSPRPRPVGRALRRTARRLASAHPRRQPGSAGRRLPRGRWLGGARAGRGSPAVGRAAGAPATRSPRLGPSS